MLAPWRGLCWGFPQSHARAIPCTAQVRLCSPTPTLRKAPSPIAQHPRDVASSSAAIHAARLVRPDKASGVRNVIWRSYVDPAEPAGQTMAHATHALHLSERRARGSTNATDDRLGASFDRGCRAWARLHRWGWMQNTLLHISSCSAVLFYCCWAIDFVICPATCSM